jgi:hypothetical protein
MTKTKGSVKHSTLDRSSDTPSPVDLMLSPYTPRHVFKIHGKFQVAT